MPPKGRAKKTLEKTPAAVPVPEPVPEPIVEPVPVPEPVIEPVVVAPAVEPKPKKGKKQPKVVAVVTPDGIEGSFLPEPRRPLIAHLQISSSDVQFHETPLFYDPNPPGQPEPYDAQADDMFGKHNEEILQDAIAEAAEAQTPVEVETEQKPSAGLDAFVKCDLMVQYRDLKASQTIPQKTEIACFWCAHSFAWQPCIIPEREEKGIYRVYGNFCSPNCCMAYLLHESLDTHVRWERVALLHRLYGKNYSTGRIFPSPARESLQLFGGSVPIQQYRATLAEGKVRVDIQMPPMVSILGSIDTKPIDFYDSSMKHTISPLLGEVVPKAEEGLRLKRSKPLKEKESTLDSVLKIQIKSKK
jgi:hypothetical protein